MISTLAFRRVVNQCIHYSKNQSLTSRGWQTGAAKEAAGRQPPTAANSPITTVKQSQSRQSLSKVTVVERRGDGGESNQISNQQNLINISYSTTSRRRLLRLVSLSRLLPITGLPVTGCWIGRCSSHSFSSLSQSNATNVTHIRLSLTVRFISSSSNKTQLRNQPATQLDSKSKRKMSPEEQSCDNQSVPAVKPEVVFVLGGPGAGKGTQCQLIVDHFGFVHLSAGDLLRAERAQPGSQYGELIEEHIRNGTIVPVEITCSLLERAMNRTVALQLSAKQGGDSKEASGDISTSDPVVYQNGGTIKSSPKGSVIGKFLIDGFPRNQDNFDGWQRVMAPKVDMKFVLVFDCPEQVCVNRCLERGAGGSGRSDDNEASLRKRLVTFLNETKPIIEYYEKLDLVRHVNANRGKEEVFADVKRLFQQ